MNISVGLFGSSIKILLFEKINEDSRITHPFKEQLDRSISSPTHLRSYQKLSHLH